MRSFAKGHPTLAYFVLTFAVSWGGFLAVVGPSGFDSSSWQSDPKFPLAVAAMLMGPTVAGLLMTGVADGRAGFRDLASRLTRWRAPIGCYLMALLPAPLLAGGLLLALSLTSPIFTSDNKVAVLVSGVVAGLTAIFEEVGWTGFAAPKLRLRYSVFTTGIVVGVVWGAWHLLQQFYIGGTYAGSVPPAIYMILAVLAAIAQLTAYRILMMWVYDRTKGSLLIVTLMHGSLIASTIFIFTPIATGVTFLTYVWSLTAGFWVIVAALALGGQFPADR